MEQPTFTTLTEVLRYRARTTPDREALFFARDSGDPEDGDRLTFGQLDARARRVAAWLADRLPDAGRGQRVMLLHPPGLDFASAYFGCVYAGAVAVPAPAPDGSRAQSDRVRGILRDCGAGAVLADSADGVTRAAWLAGLDAPVVGPATVDALPDADFTPVTVAPDSLAMLQYTSGSTSEPRGVMLSHASMLANLELIRSRLDNHPGTRLVGWLPFYHDMGLTQILSMVYAGAWSGLMSPTAFLKRPYRWLRLIDHYRADLSVAPNFAFDLLARRVPDEQLAGLDLSTWTAALNGSEPISAAALDAFARRFARYGFRAEALYPCYGMAEATLFVSGGRRCDPPVLRHVLTEQLEAGRLRVAEPGAATRTLVGCGRIVDFDLRVVDPATRRPLPDGDVGEIWLRGPSIGAGYLGRAEQTAATFRATTATGEGGFLRTGDLGAVLDGELFVTGRIKETLIVHGRNLYPYDIERAIARLDPAVEAGVGAVVGVGPERQEIAVVYEVRSRSGDDALRRLVAAVRELVSREYGVRVGAVSLVRAGQVPRTTSGKIQRDRTRRLFLDRALDVVYEEVAPGVRRPEPQPAPAAQPAPAH